MVYLIEKLMIDIRLFSSFYVFIFVELSQLTSRLLFTVTGSWLLTMKYCIVTSRTRSRQAGFRCALRRISRKYLEPIFSSTNKLLGL